MTFSCYDCDNLDKSKIKWSEGKYCFNYGCKEKGREFTCGWCRDDNELKYQGCSEFVERKEESYQISMFD